MLVTTIHDVRDIRLEERPVPQVQAPTDAIIKVVAACVCGSDLWRYRGDNGKPKGETIGHEAVGIVEEVGGEVTSFKPGDFVIAPFCHSDNTCASCRAGMTSACDNLGFTDGGQGEYALITQAEGSLIKTDGVPDPALIPGLLTLSDVMATGWHAAVTSRVTPGSTALVVGDGAVGLCGVLAARELGADRILVMSRHAPRQAVARTFGATDLIPERGADAVQRVLDLTDGVGADAVLECVGTDDSMTTAIDAARAGAMVGFVGVPHGVTLPIRTMFERNVGLSGGMAPVRAYLPDLLERTLSGAIDPSPVFDLTLPLTDVAQAYAAMDERRAIKVLLQP